MDSTHVDWNITVGYLRSKPAGHILREGVRMGTGKFGENSIRCPPRDFVTGSQREPSDNVFAYGENGHRKKNPTHPFPSSGSND